MTSAALRIPGHQPLIAGDRELGDIMLLLIVLDLGDGRILGWSGLRVTGLELLAE